MEEIVGGIIVVVGIVNELDSSDSSDSDPEDNIIPYILNTNYRGSVRKRSRIINYIDNVVALYCDRELCYMMYLFPHL